MGFNIWNNIFLCFELDGVMHLGSLGCMLFEALGFMCYNQLSRITTGHGSRFSRHFHQFICGGFRRTFRQPFVRTVLIIGRQRFQIFSHIARLSDRIGNLSVVIFSESK